MRTYVYEITHSAVLTVKVGTFIVDTTEFREGEGERRVWSLYNDTTGDFEDGWAGVRLDRVCTACRRDHRKVRPHKHDGPHGDGPHLIPTRTAAVSR